MTIGTCECGFKIDGQSKPDLDYKMRRHLDSKRHKIRMMDKIAAGKKNGKK
jgi:hypothetical protein